MPSRTEYTPLTVTEIEELVPVLHSADVFEFIGGMPPRSDFILGLQRALMGPPAKCVGEHWINYAVRLIDTGELIGRVEATVHDDIAEVAFLYNPAFWGRGYATEGLLWLHQHLQGTHKQVSAFWATVHRKNVRSAALLQRAGYARVATHGLPLLYSYNEGDVVFCRSVANPSLKRSASGRPRRPSSPA